MSQRIDNSAEQKDSRLTQGGDIDRYDNRLGWWERRDLEQRDDDFKFIVKSNEAGRPDRLAFRAYGHAKYAWLVLQYNNIVDITTELVPGTEILLPNPSRLMADILGQQVGGNRVE